MPWLGSFRIVSQRLMLEVTLQNLLSPKELERVMGVSRTTLWRLREHGLPFVRVGRQLRFDPREVERWLSGMHETAFQASLALGEAGTPATVPAQSGDSGTPQPVGEDLPPCH